MRVFLILIPLLLAASQTAQVRGNKESASNNFFQDSKRGWFYYEPVPVPEEKKKDESKTVEQSFPKLDKTPEEIAAMLEAEKRFIRSIPWGDLGRLSADEFRQTYDRTKDIATMRPDLENTMAYRRLHQYATDQSAKFTTIMEVVNNQNEFIDPSLAMSAYGGKMHRAEDERKRKEWFAEHQDRAAIVIFHGGVKDPSYVHQESAIEMFKREYPTADVIWVDAVASPEIAGRMGLVALPETWLAYKKEDGMVWRRLGSGPMPVDEIAKKALFMYEHTIASDIFTEK